LQAHFLIKEILMKVCVTSTGNSLASPVDPRFGRCGVFFIVDTETMECSALPNPAMSSGGGAGTKAARIVVEAGARAVLTGNIGPNAFEALSAAGIQVYTGLRGTVQDAIAAFKSGTLKPVAQPTVKAHAGI
jgi:predicted Fe-Mo cluster-binding NifX family protein